MTPHFDFDHNPSETTILVKICLVPFGTKTYINMLKQYECLLLTMV
jgi:hypothetical protein